MNEPGVMTTVRIVSYESARDENPPLVTSYWKWEILYSKNLEEKAGQAEIHNQRAARQEAHAEHELVTAPVLHQRGREHAELDLPITAEDENVPYVARSSDR